ncbi:metal ABC transporter permease [Methanocella arvoryzae]|uniref:ABC-type transport system, permease component (ABC-3 family) n=1 Tax=Methanocella arvoryzae (strain DSM 22066 / NBRC 105507 / MRE50) TaxID=351160 RepID=Q0W5K7_METAR|nr:metal ABC transporter permease [Methanocella arvoryzae]CAJ36336.1 putative ABC-type transport system, permease component (ABC-3 family) [Methanocella arvoryzae MRE50]
MLEFLIPNNIVCHAVEAMIFASISCSILGVIIARMNISSVGFTMSHAAFAGAAIGLFLGMDSILTAVIFSLGVAALIGPVSERAKMSADTTLGVLFAMSMAVAVFFISYMQYSGKGISAGGLLFGDLISLYREEIYLLGLVSLLTVLFIVVFYKEILSLMFHMKIAEASGIRTKLVYYALLFIIAVSVALSINIVGGLIIYVWLVVPAAIAYQFCFNVRGMFIVAPLVALAVSIPGVFAGFEYNLPIGPLIGMAFTFVFALSVILSTKRRITCNKN